MLKVKARYIYFALLANGLCSCSVFDSESNTPQSQLASYLEESPAVYLSKPAMTETISRAERRVITRELADNDKRHREILLAQKEAEIASLGDLPQLPEIKTPKMAKSHRSETANIGSHFTTTGPQLNTGIDGAFSASSDANTSSPILNISDMRHPKTPGLNTTQEEESSVESNKAPRPNQPELRGYRSPSMKNDIPIPYKSN